MKISEIDAEISSLLRAFEKTNERISAAAEMTGSNPADLSELAELIDRRIGDLVEARGKIVEKIQQIPEPAQRQVIILRDVAGMKWHEISAEMNFSLRHVRRLYERACMEIGIEEG